MQEAVKVVSMGIRGKGTLKKHCRGRFDNTVLLIDSDR